MEGGKRFKGHQILLFTRYPEPGKTKTRLIPALGEIRAAALQKRMTERIVGVAGQFCRKTGAGLTLFGEGGSVNGFKKWLGSDIHVRAQVSGDIGRKMAAALGMVFKSGTHRAVLVGSDIPRLSVRHFQEAFSALSANDIVLGPAADGGYWLVGAKRPHDIFSGIDWGTDQVFEQTIGNIRRMGLKFHCLEKLWDIDTINDVRRFIPEEACLKPYVSVIIPALNEEKNIRYAVAGAMDENAEVIVVDGGSTDKTKAVAEDLGVIVLSSQQGRAVQQNTGATAARGDVLLFLHADTRLPAEYVRHVFGALLDSKTVLWAFCFKTDMDKPLMRFFEKVTNFRSIHLNLPYGDQGFFLQRQQFFKAGGFPEVAIAEDLLLVRKLAKAGSIGVLPAQAVTSGRRWRQIGMFRTFAVNQIILFGCLLGIPPEKLASLYLNDK